MKKWNFKAFICRFEKEGRDEKNKRNVADKVATFIRVDRDFLSSMKLFRDQISPALDFTLYPINLTTPHALDTINSIQTCNDIASGSYCFIRLSTLIPFSAFFFSMGVCRDKGKQAGEKYIVNLPWKKTGENFPRFDFPPVFEKKLPRKKSGLRFF